MLQTQKRKIGKMSKSRRNKLVSNALWCFRASACIPGLQILALQFRRVISLRASVSPGGQRNTKQRPVAQGSNEQILGSCVGYCC